MGAIQEAEKQCGTFKRKEGSLIPNSMRIIDYSRNSVLFKKDMRKLAAMYKKEGN